MEDLADFLLLWVFASGAVMGGVVFYHYLSDTLGWCDFLAVMALVLYAAVCLAIIELYCRWNKI